MNDDKQDKENYWYSDRIKPIQHSLFAGIQFYSGMNLKFKYYLSNFHNSNYTVYVDNLGAKPYENNNSNMWYISLNITVFKGTKFYYTAD